MISVESLEAHNGVVCSHPAVSWGRATSGGHISIAAPAGGALIYCHESGEHVLLLTAIRHFESIIAAAAFLWSVQMYLYGCHGDRSWEWRTMHEGN